MMAAVAGFAEIVEVLLSRGADLSIVDRAGRSPRTRGGVSSNGHGGDPQESGLLNDGRRLTCRKGQGPGIISLRPYSRPEAPSPSRHPRMSS